MGDGRLHQPAGGRRLPDPHLRRQRRPVPAALCASTLAMTLNQNLTSTLTCPSLTLSLNMPLTLLRTLAVPLNRDPNIGWAYACGSLP